MGNPSATSDDEYDPSSGTYEIKRKIGRASYWEAFIRALDERQAADLRLIRNREPQDRTRKVPLQNQRVSPFRALPANMPLDYFDVNFYNELPTKIQRKITPKSPQIALPSSPVEIFTKKASWRALKTQAFMAMYGNTILAQYDLPSSKSTRDDKEGVSPYVVEGSEEEIELDGDLELNSDMEISDSDDETGSIRRDFTARMEETDGI